MMKKSKGGLEKSGNHMVKEALQGEWVMLHGGVYGRPGGPREVDKNNGVFGNQVNNDLEAEKS